MEYPVRKVVVPAELKGQKNGRLDRSLLSKTTLNGEMWRNAAIAMNVMAADAYRAGIKLVNIGDYRSYAGQVKMFKDRYSTTDLGRSPRVTRFFEGQLWYLKPGKSPSAAPDPTGKRGSNHGWGLAMDLAVRGKLGRTVPLGSSPKAMEWMCANAPKYGFYLQGQPKLPNGKPNPEWEAWHWQYAVGSRFTPRVKEVIAALMGGKK